jgi:hypothetical protein
MELRNFTHDEMEAEFQRRVSVVQYLAKNRINDYRQLWKLVTAYYKDPKEVMARIETPVPVPGTP